MKFTRWTFIIAGVYGIVMLVPLYFSEKQISTDFPPAITHLEYFYGFISIALVWQILFLLIAFNPLRYKLVIIPAILEKLSFGIITIFLLGQQKISPVMLGPGIIDIVFGCLFIVIFFKMKNKGPSTEK
jgi:hypothetical protein